MVFLISGGGGVCDLIRYAFGVAGSDCRTRAGDVAVLAIARGLEERSWRSLGSVPGAARSRIQLFYFKITNLRFF